MSLQVLSFEAIAGPVTEYLGNFRRYYPDIQEWFDSISSEFLLGNRRCLVACKGSEIRGLAITKLGLHAKLCHVSVSPTARERGLGAQLMASALAGILESGAEDVCVTTSEEVYRQHGSFFGSAGFGVVDWHLNRYRSGVSEIIWAAPISKLIIAIKTPLIHRLAALSARRTGRSPSTQRGVAGLVDGSSAQPREPMQRSFETRSGLNGHPVQPILPFVSIGSSGMSSAVHGHRSYTRAEDRSHP